MFIKFTALRKKSISEIIDSERGVPSTAEVMLHEIPQAATGILVMGSKCRCSRSRCPKISDRTKVYFLQLNLSHIQRETG